MGRWIVVSDTLMRIINGPVLWDPGSPMELPQGQRLIAEGSPALSGYAAADLTVAPTPDSNAAAIAALQQHLAARTMRRAKPKTGLAIAIGGGTTELTATWKPAMPTAAYTVTIADTLPNTATAAVVGTPTAESCTIRITSTAFLSLGTELDVTAWT